MRRMLSTAAALAVTLSGLPVAAAMQSDMMMSKSKGGPAMYTQRVSRRTVTSNARRNGRTMKDECKGLSAIERGMCLNPKLKQKMVKNEMKQNMKSYWYKLDGAGKLWWKNGETWERSKTGLWQDADGKWLKVGEGKLWWSADSGKTWSEVPEWTWKGTDGKWYKFDSTWMLWWSTDGGTTWSEVQNTMWPGM